ncbi:hypothetical protein Q9L58_007584 [Maublancomyces gigas]|uniref:HNH nuclease domain-containing protein n=1 Tax=Discina gigas TaxID=1032678 RepID=A0ABR3GDA8_9PEZI
MEPNYRCNLPEDAHIREILRASTPFFHKDTSDTLFNPKITDDEAVRLLIDVANTLWSGAHSLYTGKRSTVSNASTPTPMSITPRTPRNRAQTLNCLQRDKGACIITGRKKIDSFPVEVAHLFPYALSNTAECRNETFWKSIEMFLGQAKTNRLWGLVGHENVNSLKNLVTMDRSLHDMFDKGSIQFLPFTHTEPPRPIGLESLETDADSSPSYQIQIDFRTNHKAGYITTTKGIPESEPPVFVRHGHFFVIPASQESGGQFPDPAFWRIRTGIYDLLYKFGAAAEPKQDLWESDDAGWMGDYNALYDLPDTIQYDLDPKVLSAMLLRLSNIT